MEELFHMDEDGIIHLGEDPISEDFFHEEDEDSITVDAVDDALYPVQDFIERKLSSLGCNKKEIQRIRLAVEEIFVNICSYAYKEKNKCARLCCSMSGEEARVIILFVDSGIPFNPLLQEADTSGAQFVEREGGYGIHLVKNIMDKVTYEYKDGKNVLRLEKVLKF